MERPGSTSPLTPPSPSQGPPEVQPDLAQQSLVSALRSSFAVLRLVMIVLVVLYLSSGVFRIQPGEQGVIARLGRLVTNKATDTPVFSQGWIWWALPDPFDEKIRISGNLEQLEIDSFLFRRFPDDIAKKTDIATLRPPTSALRPGVDGALLTGDKNLSHGLWQVEYQIDDAAQFVTHVGERPADLEPLLQRLLESAIVREVAYRKVEEVTRTKIDIIADRVRRRLQDELDRLHVGVRAVKVNPRTIVPPQVAAAFVEVTNAENERKQQEHAARQRATEILNQAAGAQHRVLLEQIRAYGAAQLTDRDPGRLEPMRAEIDTLLADAQGEVAVKLREARADASTVREQISREYQEFRYWLEQYRRYPQATLVSLWAQMRRDVLDNKDNELFWVPDSDVIEILVNRDPNRAIEAERERLLKQMSTPASAAQP